MEKTIEDKIRSLRTDLAFLRADDRGGPDRSKEKAEILRQIEEMQALSKEQN